MLLSSPLILILFVVSAVILLALGLWLGQRLASARLALLQANWQREAELAQQPLLAHQAELRQQLALAEQQGQMALRQQAELQQRLHQREQQFDALSQQERSSSASARGERERADSLAERLAQRDTELASLQQRFEQLHQQHALLQRELAEERTGRIKEREALEEKLALLESNKQALKTEFEHLAGQIFDARQRQFSEQSSHSLTALLQPMRDQLEGFRKRVDEVHTQNVEGQSSLRSELDKLRQLNQQITTEAHNLTRALKGDKKLQGSWGEQQVELLLERSGLKKGEQYEREASFRDDDGNQKRPDFIVHLPDRKHIIIDSKVSLVDYSRYVEADNDEERRLALVAHVQALRNHVTTLRERNYPGLAEMNSPDFTFLFLPIEPSYQVAVEHDPALFQWAYEQNIAIVTATTLMPMLRVVANLWGLQRQNQFSRELAEQAGKVHDKLAIFIDTMDKLGNQIDGVHKSYRKAFDQLKDGRGSLVRQVERFVDLGAKVSKKLPASVAGGDEEGVLTADGDHYD